VLTFEMVEERLLLPEPPSVFASLPHQHFKIDPLKSLPFPFTIAVAAAA